MIVVQFVMLPSLLKVANHGRGCFLYIRKTVAFSLTTDANHSRNSSGDDGLDVVARNRYVRMLLNFRYVGSCPFHDLW